MEITIRIIVEGTGDGRTASLSLDDPRYPQNFNAYVARDEESAQLNEAPDAPWVGYDDTGDGRRFYATFERALAAESHDIAADAAAALCEENDPIQS